MTDKTYDVTVRVMFDMKFKGKAPSPSVFQKGVLKLKLWALDADYVSLHGGTFVLRRARAARQKVVRVTVRKAK